MDKPKKTNRFFSTPSSNKKQQHLLKHSGSKDGGDMEVVMERSKKKEKVKGLSSIGSAAKENSQIGGGGGSDDGEEELLLKTSATAAKRFKIHSKPLNDCNAIDLAVVPRKIRSAMIKRNRESLSPPLPEAKKPHRTPNGTHQPHLSSMQKAKQKMKQGVPGQLESIPITKDEEEVAETLFALARMIPDKPINYRVDQISTEAKHPPVQQSTEVPMLASEASKKESAKSLKEDIIVEATNVPSSVEGSGSDAATLNFLPDTSMMHRPSIIRNPKFMLDRGIIGPLSDSRISQLQKNEHTDLTSLNVASTSGVLIIPCHTNRRLQGTQHKASSFCEQKKELWPVAAILKKQEEHSMKENNDGDKRFASCMEGTPVLSLVEGNNHNGSGLGLSLAGSHDRELAWSSKSKVPSWLDSAKEPDLAGDGLLKEKVNSVTLGKTQPWKKCATHVHISRLIRVLQASEEKSMLPPIANQMLPNGTKHGASAPSSLNGLISFSDKNGLNRYTSVDGCLNDGDAGTNMNEVRNRILQDKQNRDFLSLSTGGGGSLRSTASFNAVNQRINKSDSSVQFHVPYLHPVVQNPSPVPFNVHGRSSSLYPDHLTVRATQQLKSEQMASPFYSPQHAVHADSANHHLHHQQQQQQQMWAAHYMSGRNSTASYSSNWQHGKQDSPIYIPGECSQPPAHSSLSLRHEGFSAKFPSNMPLQQQQQQQQLFFLSSSSASSSRGKMHHQHHHPHHLAGGYDGASGVSMLTARLT
ncbi:hypothetical protein MKW92_048526 [Papaver armeniacum]|nr:hypothetical protein MKW92_048526 [Papaver armeniacum]